MKYPENERILIVRPCLKYICLGNKPASKLLSLLLYYARNCDEKEAEYTFMTTQEELIEDLIEEMDVKTLHRTAIPMLRLLGFLDVDGSSYRYKYTVHLNLISYLLANYKDNKREIKSVLLSEIEKQLDKLPIEQKDTFPIVHVRRQLDNCLKQIDNLPIQLEKCPIQIDICLIAIRQLSNSKRGRKPSPVAHSKAISEEHRLDRDITDNKENTEREEVATATARSQPSSQKEVVDGDNSTHQRSLVDSPSSGSSTSTRRHSSTHNMVTHPPAPKKPQTNVTTPKRPKQQPIAMPEPEIPEKAVIIMDRWDSIHRKPIPRTPKTIQAAQLLMVYDPSEDDLRDCEKWLYTTDRPGKPWHRSHGVHLLDIAEKIGSWQSLQNAPPAKPNKEESNEHKVTQQPANAFIERCLDKDYNKRKLEEMREKNALKRQAQAEGVQS